MIKPPPVKPLELPPPTGASLEELVSASRYGTNDATTVSALDEANPGALRDFDATAERVAANAEGRARIKERGGEALSAAGTSYAEEIEEAVYTGQAPPSPDLTEMSARHGGLPRAVFPQRAAGPVSDRQVGRGPGDAARQ